METELSRLVIAIIGTGVALALLNVGLFAWLRADIGSLRKEHGQRLADLREQTHTLEVELRERMAKVEGLLGGLREAVTGTRAV